MDFKNFYKQNLIKELLLLLNKAKDRLLKNMSLYGYTSAPKLQVASTKYNFPLIQEAYHEDKWKNQRFIDWLTKRGFIVNCTVPHSRSGSYGSCYYSDSPDKCDGNGHLICKLTEEQDEAEMASIAIDYKKIKSINIPHLDICEIDGVYAILQERVSPVSLSDWDSNLSQAIHFVGDVLSYNVKRDSPNDEVRKGMKLAREKQLNQKVISYIELLLKVAFELFEATGRIFDDISYGNVGKDKNDNFVFYDLGINYQVIHKPVPSIARI